MFDAKESRGPATADRASSPGAPGRTSLTQQLGGRGPTAAATADALVTPITASGGAGAAPPDGGGAGFPDMFDGILPGGAPDDDRRGQPLPGALRNRFEASLGTDLSDVRIHTGEAAADRAASLDARAYALGSDIHFGDGQYDPGSAGGDWLLAHEVAHTVQQRAGDVHPQARREVSEPGDAAERDADRAAAAMVDGVPAAPLAPAARGVYRTPDYATAPDRAFGAASATAAPPHLHQIQQLNSDHWRHERTVMQPIELDGLPPFDGEFIVSRFYMNNRPAFLPRGADGRINLGASGDRDYGPLPDFIEAHPQLARLWGLRLLRNPDGLVTHLLTPEPRTFHRILESMRQHGMANLTPNTNIAAAEGNLNDQEFAQAQRAGALPVSLPSPTQSAQTTHPLYYHDWMQHIPGFLTLGRNTMHFLRQIGEMVRDLYGIADRASNTPVENSLVESAHAVTGQRSRLDPAAQAARDAPLGNALRSAIESVATNGKLIEEQITYLSNDVARPAAQLDDAALRTRYEQLWSDAALTRDFATPDLGALTPDQRTAYNTALGEMRQRRAALLTALTNERANQAQLIADDIRESRAFLARADGPLARFTVRAAGQDLSALDEAGFARQVEAFVQAGTFDQARTDIIAERDRVRATVQQARNQQGAVRQYGSDASGAAVASPEDIERERRLEVLESMVQRIEQAHGAFSNEGRDQFIQRFEHIGHELAAHALARAEAARSGQASAEGAAAHITAAQIAAARARLANNYVWTDEQVFQAVWRATNLAQHPMRAQWITLARPQRAAAQDHTVRNALLAALVVLALVVAAEIALPAAAAAGAAEGTGAATTAGVFVVEGETVAATVTGVRVTLQAASVVSQLSELALAEAALDQAGALMWAL